MKDFKKIWMVFFGSLLILHIAYLNFDNEIIVKASNNQESEGAGVMLFDIKGLIVIGFLIVIIVVIILFIHLNRRDCDCKSVKEKNHELMEANHLKNKFLSNVSHEIRTPMNAIIGLTTICSHNLENKEVLKNNLDKIDTAAHYLLSLINDILDISRIESGRIVFNEEVVILDEFISQINTLIGERAKERGVQYQCVIEDSIASHYIFDRLKLQQVIINLLTNAIKFTPKDGSVVFHMEQEEIGDEKALLSIRVTDTGIGIDEEFLPNIFDAFTQEYTDNTTPYSGSGLGLAISKNIINLLGGEIQVTSSKGKGSTFYVKVCVGVAKEYHKLERQISKERQEVLYEFLDKRIMIAEDNEINLEVAKTLLEHVGILVDCVKNGKEAVNRFNDAPSGYYHAILMDIRMPVMDGLDATKEIRKLKKEDAKRIPIIAMTANALEEDIQKSILAGMNCHMTKPIEPKTLYETLAKALRGY